MFNEQKKRVLFQTIFLHYYMNLLGDYEIQSRTINGRMNRLTNNLLVGMPCLFIYFEKIHADENIPTLIFSMSFLGHTHLHNIYNYKMDYKNSMLYKSHPRTIKYPSPSPPAIC